MDRARELGVDLQATCAGRGSCGKCRVRIREGADCLGGISDLERRLLSREEVGKGFRLACVCRVARAGGIRVEVPDESRIGQQRLLAAGAEVKVTPRPAVRKVFIRIEPPSLEDVRSDADRLLEAIAGKGSENPLDIDYRLLRDLPHRLRSGQWAVTASLWGDAEIFDLEPGNTTSRMFGAAFDIGSTKVAGYLVDLVSGKTLATASAINPQMSYGEDIISRISYVAQNERGLDVLHDAIVQVVNRLLEELCAKADLQRDAVLEVSVAGNTVMHHIFFHVDPVYVGSAPYAAAVRSPLEIRAREVGVQANSGSRIYALPSVAGFVGADAIADILATGIHESDRISMTIDIGTNTEITLGSRDGLACCSAPSGPAWEGAHISHGMRAGSGAIESLAIDEQTLEPTYETIGRGRPSGICGSGIVDAMAEMLKAGIIDRSGQLDLGRKNERIRERDRHAEYVVAFARESATGKDIVVTQEDVREVQLAKAAIYAGASLLMRKLAVKVGDIARLYVAGAFGTYIDVRNARLIGLYPEVPLETVKFVGNAAGTGARMALLSTEVRDVAAKVAKMIGSRVELGADPSFQEEFLQATYFPHRDTARFPQGMQMLRRV